MNFCSNILGATCAGVIVLGISSVNAADIYQGGGLKDGVVTPAFGGIYFGVNGGGSFGASNNITVANSRDTSQADIGQFFRDSGFGGIQLGYTSSGFGWGNSVVLGIETDFQGSGINSSFTRADLNYDFAPAFFNASQSIDYFGTVRVRFGYLFGHALVYGTAGWAYGDVKTTVNINHGFNTVTQDSVETGWAGGGGVEYWFAPSWSFKVEYQYIDLGSDTITSIRADGSYDHLKIFNDISTVRVGLNYYFSDSYVPLK